MSLLCLKKWLVWMDPEGSQTMQRQNPCPLATLRKSNASNRPANYFAKEATSSTAQIVDAPRRSSGSTSVTPRGPVRSFSGQLNVRKCQPKPPVLKKMTSDISEIILFGGEPHYAVAKRHH
ncbi:hypothetical protein AAVH_18623 [Aphelenchoides avenae]|nr:hypothetical protein AAVH_18623 [Aphelenchus avenae]